MDLSTLPDLVQHFAVAAHFAPDAVHHGIEQCRNFAHAFSHDSPLTLSEKFFHGGKFIALGGLLIFTMYEGNPEAIIGAGFAEADTIYDICKAGGAGPKGPSPTA